MAVRVREAGIDDLDTVARLRLAFLAEHRSTTPEALGPGFTKRTAAFVRRHHDDGSLRSWLAVADTGDGGPYSNGGTTIGIVSLLVLAMPPRPGDDRDDEGYVINMYVVPHARREGVGRALFDECLAWARGYGLRRLLLVATELGRPLYETAGFRTNDAWMELRLPAP
jgi:GNAT superfamily N-acetyltransferase